MQDQDYTNLSIDEFNALFAKPDVDTSNDLLTEPNEDISSNLLSEPNIETSIEEEKEEETKDLTKLSIDDFNALLQGFSEEEVQQDTVQQIQENPLEQVQQDTIPQQRLDFPLEETVVESTQAQISPTHPISDDILDLDSSIAFADPEELLHSEIAKTVEDSMTPSQSQKETVPYKDAIETVKKQLDGLREQGTGQVETNPLWNVSGQNTAKMAELLISNPMNMASARQNLGIFVPEYYVEPLLSETGFAGRAGNSFIEGMTMGYTIQRPMRPARSRTEAVADIVGQFAGAYTPFATQLKAGQTIVMGTTAQIKKIKPVAKYIDDIVLKNKKLASFGEGALANTIGFNIHGQLGAGQAEKSVEKKLKEMGESTFHATLFSGVGSLQQFGKISALTGAGTVTLLGFAMGPWLTLDENATEQEKTNAFSQSVANGLLLGTMHLKGTASEKIDGLKDFIKSTMPETSLSGQRKMIVESINTVLKNKDIETIGKDIRQGIIEANRIARIKDVTFKDGQQLKLELIDIKKTINNEIAKENIKKYKKEVVPKEDPTEVKVESEVTPRVINYKIYTKPSEPSKPSKPTKPTKPSKSSKPRFGRDESTRKIKSMLEGLEEPSARYRYDKSISQLIGDKQSYRYDSLVQLTKDLGIYNPKARKREDIVDALVDYYKKPVLESKKPPKKIDGLKISYDNTGKMKLDIFSTKELRQIAEKIGINTKKLNRQKMLDAIMRADSQGKANKDPIPAKKESELNEIMENVAYYEAEILGLSKQGKDFSNLEVQQKKASLRKAKEIEKEIRSKYDPNKSESVNVDIFPGISLVRDILKARKQSKDARRPLTDGELEAIDSFIKGKNVTPESIDLALKALAEKPMSKTIKDQGLSNVVTEVRKIFNPLADMPKAQQEQYLDLRNKFAGRNYKISQKIEEWVSNFKNYSEEELRLSYRVLNGQADIKEIKNPDLVKQTKLIRRLFDTFGQELVNRGLLSQEAYDGKKGNYLTRIYLRYILDKGAGLGSTTSLSLAYRKQRKQLSQEERDILGEIKTPESPTEVGLYRTLGDITKFDFLNAIASNEKFVFQPSRLTVDGKKYSIGQAVKEKEALQEVYFNADNAQKPVIERRIKIIDKELQKAEGVMKEPIEGFMQMPIDSRYGPLSGAYVRKSIANDLIQNIGIESATLGKRLTSYWKASKVAMNPATVMRNFLSNPVQLHMSGMSYQDIARLMISAPLKMKKGDIDYINAGKSGVFGGTWAKAEINALLEQSAKFKKEYEKSGDWKTAIQTFGRIVEKPIAKTAQKAGNFYSKIDEYYKFIKYLHGKEKGLSDAEATRDAQKWVMDYSLVSPTVKGLRENAFFAPFITYQTKIAPLIIDAINPKTDSNPIALIAPYIVAQAITDYSFNKFNIKDESEQELLKLAMGRQIVESNAPIILPYKDEQGRPQAINLEYGLPHEGVLNMTKNFVDGNMSGVVNALGLTPGAMLLSALYTGTIPTQDGGHIEIWNSSTPIAERNKQFLEFAGDVILPGFLSSNGPLMNLLKDASITDVQQTLSQELSKFTAYTLKPVDEKNLMKANSAFEAKLRQISLDANRKMKKAVRVSKITGENYIDTEEYFNIQKQLGIKILKTHSEIYGNLKYETTEGFMTLKELMDVSIDRLEELSYDKSKMDMSSQGQINQVMSEEELKAMREVKESASTP